MAISTSKNGGISVRANEQGLPLAVHLDDAQVRRDPRVLAADIVRHCHQASQMAGLVRRSELEAQGVPVEVINQMGLPNPDEVSAAEVVDEWESPSEPDTWLRTV